MSGRPLPSPQSGSQPRFTNGTYAYEYAVQDMSASHPVMKIVLAELQEMFDKVSTRLRDECPDIDEVNRDQYIHSALAIRFGKPTANGILARPRASNSWNLYQATRYQSEDLENLKKDIEAEGMISSRNVSLIIKA